MPGRASTGSIELLTQHERYLKDGVCDLHRVSAGWKEKLAEALARGYEGLRASGNTPQQYGMHQGRWAESV